jgi:(E)-4-hydroxy-3-methylbut-2-enyl-diphosphate synthase
VYPFTYQRRHSREVLNIGARHVPVVIADLSGRAAITPATLFAWGYRYSVPLDKWNITDQACDYAFIGKNTIDFEIPGTLGIIQDHATWLGNAKPRIGTTRSSNKREYLGGAEQSSPVQPGVRHLGRPGRRLTSPKLKADPTAVLLIDTHNAHGMAEQRRLFFELIAQECPVPVIIGRAYGAISNDTLVLNSSTDMGPLLIDGLGDGVFIADEHGGREDLVCRTAFGILQATRTRTSKTEYISCPSCGRTLFDLQETTAKIRARTSHLKGVKIGIMGCIVNGPGDGRRRLRLRGHRPWRDHPVPREGSGEAQRAQRTRGGRAHWPDQGARDVGRGGRLTSGHDPRHHSARHDRTTCTAPRPAHPRAGADRQHHGRLVHEC